MKGPLAQLGERLHGMQEVSGSIPLGSTNIFLYLLIANALLFCVEFSQKPFLQFVKTSKLSDIAQECQTVELVFTVVQKSQMHDTFSYK